MQVMHIQARFRSSTVLGNLVDMKYLEDMFLK